MSPGKVASSPGYHLTSLVSTKDSPTLVPPRRDSPGPRTSRKVSVFISLQGVSTMRAASRTPSVAFAKHWGRETRGCHWDLGPGRKGCPSRSAPVGSKAPAVHVTGGGGGGVSGLLMGRRGQVEIRLT